jgi:small-conductance mechanosensitive channel
MSKKTNTLLFILIASLANILLTIAGFLLLYLPYALFIAPRLPPSSVIWILALLFLLALGISFMAYHALLKWFIKKVDLHKRFDPLVKGPTSRG